MIIDVHGHIGRSANTQTELIAIDAYVRSCSIHSLLISNMRAAVTSDPHADLDETDANMAVLEAIERRPRLSAVYWVRPGRPDSHPQAVAGALETEPFVAILLAPRLNEFGLDDPKIDAYVMAAARVNRPVLVICGRDERSRPRRAYDLARRFPRMAFILLNATGEPHWREAAECAEQAIKAGDANLYLTTANVPQAEALATIQSIGSARVLFGSDALALGGDHARTVRTLTDQLRSDLPEESSRAVLGENALKLFAIQREG
jgi:predicted TIM-barrel fold metal-dependent hydrolase